MNSLSPENALAQSKFFLRMLDVNAQCFHFRTFDDKEDSDRIELLGKRSGSLLQHLGQLRELNENEAGVYVVVNEGGHSDKEITCIRSVFADVDIKDMSIEPMVKALEPHMILESSPGKHHLYWLVTPDFPIEKFKPVQKAIASAYKTDTSVCNPSRVMRLPGFMHNKNTPFEVLFKSVNKDLPRYSLDNIADGLGLNLANPKTSTISPLKQPMISTLGRGLDIGGYVEPDRIEEGGRNAALMSYIGHLRGCGEYEDAVIEKTCQFNADKCKPPLDDAEVNDLLSRYPEQQNIRPSDLDDADWPEPDEVKTALKPVPPFDLDMLPSVFKPYVADVSELMDTPADLLAIPLMVVAAATLGNKWCIAPKAKDHSWLVTPVLWGAIVAPPGAKKSPCLNKALMPLHVIEEQLATVYQTKLQQHQAALLMYDAAIKKAKAQAAKSQPIQNIPIKPECPEAERLMTNDTTYQKLGDILHWSPRGVAVVQDELVGLLEGMETKGQETARAFYLSGWNGDMSYKVDRVGRPSNVIPRLALYVLGGMQPDKLQHYVRQATHGGSKNDGLIQRFQLLTYPDMPEEWNYVDRPHNHQAGDDVLNAILRLRDLKPTDVGAQNSLEGQYAYLKFTEDAQALFVEVMKGFETGARKRGVPTSIRSHFEKYPRLVAALALVTHLVDGGTGPVPLAATEKAVTWSKYLMKHAQRVYAAGDNATAVAAKALADKIKAGAVSSGFTKRTLERKNWQVLTRKDDIDAALNFLVDANWLKEETPANGEGSRTKAYIINPKVLTL